MTFQKEPSYSHAQVPKVGVLWCNLGSPAAPTTPALRRYLAEFLGDPRIVEMPRALWWLILHGIILRVRPKKSAAKYASIWTEAGSPLKLWTEKQAQGLQTVFNTHGLAVEVRYAMRYGQPSVATQLDALKATGCQRILIVPAYPQYSGTTSASVFDAVYDWARKIRHIPELRFVNRYHDHHGYIAALQTQVEQHWQQHGRADKLVLSFHGVPKATLEQGDPYHCECHKTGRLLAQALGLSPEQYVVTFQSRFGKAEWLQPYTEPTLQALASHGVKRVDVMCPGFTSDCLETLEEIAQEARETFLHAGGEAFHYIPCLNEQTQWLNALADLCEQHLAGWPVTRPSAADLEAAKASRARAMAMGAKH